MKKIISMACTAALLLVGLISTGAEKVLAETPAIVTLTYESTVNTRQVYGPEMEQIKSGLDTDSILWVRDCCNYVSYITQGRTEVDASKVMPLVKKALADGSTNVNLNLANYIKGAASTVGALPATGAAGALPVIDAASLSGLNGMTLLSSCTTKYRENQDRALNIHTAASRINGLTLQPGQAISYSTVILPRTVENGYGPGNVISGGTYVKGIGGGICQVSSTLNTAVLRAGIVPLERHPHSHGVGYLPEGLDATISGNTLDYKFMNPYAYPITIAATAQGGVLTVAIYSDARATGGITYEAKAMSGGTYIIGRLNGVEVSRVRAY